MWFKVYKDVQRHVRPRSIFDSGLNTNIRKFDGRACPNAKRFCYFSERGGITSIPVTVKRIIACKHRSEKYRSTMRRRMNPKKMSRPNNKAQILKQKIQQSHQDAVLASNRALQASIPQNTTTSRQSLHKRLKHHLATRKLSGLVKLQETCEMSYMLLFQTTQHRNRALDKIRAGSICHYGTLTPIVAYAVGDPIFTPTSSWSICGSFISSSSDIRDAVIEHLKSHAPTLQTSFVVREYTEYGYGIGEWAVRFNSPTPIFCEEMKLGAGIAFLTSSQGNTCRSLSTQMNNQSVKGSQSSMNQLKDKEVSVAGASCRLHKQPMI
ncbi:hypothetical protein BZA77DRAFT_291882 [Pyronema omphalodes]|nr:hypothetical protein BZA77DRAFT_291882 [Pyronema omphalodes]